MADVYFISEQARTDLDAILVYIAERSGHIETALRVDEKLHEAFEFLATTPYAGYTRTDILIPDRYLVWPVYSYLVIYRPDTEPIRILRVWHGKQERPEIPDL